MAKAKNKPPMYDPKRPLTAKQKRQQRTMANPPVLDGPDHGVAGLHRKGKNDYTTADGKPYYRVGSGKRSQFVAGKAKKKR